MDNTRAQQKALDDELVAPADRLKIGKSNLRLSSILKSKEPTLQVALDALKLTPFYNAFAISADVPEIYMQEFWVTVSRHHSSLRFKLNGKSHTVNIDNFRDMLKIFPKLPGQIFEEPPLEEEILSFIRDLGHTGEIKFLSDVNVNHMHQPWRSFAAIINKCLSGKTTALESLRLSRAQILWGMYHNKTVDYVYLLWEDLVYQVENKNSKKNNDMYYPRFTKVIVDYFMAKDQAIPRRNKMFWHCVRDDFMFTTIRVISKHQDTQTPKPKSTKKKADSESSPKTKLTQASKGKRIKTIAKGDKPAKKKQSVTKSKGLTVLYEKSSEKDDDDEVNVSEDNDDDNNDDDDEQTDLDNDDDEVNEEESDDESNKDGDEEVQGVNIKEEEMDEEATYEEDKANELYRDVNVNLERRDTKMIDAPRTIIQTTQVIEDTHVITTPVNPEGQQQSSSMSSGFVSNMLNPSPDTDVPVTTF
ncbi:hypothetical protein Tco_1285819 [Tanacetum coccineum]